jgi:hypothetical protein
LRKRFNVRGEEPATPPDSHSEADPAPHRDVVEVHHRVPVEPRIDAADDEPRPGPHVVAAHEDAGVGPHQQVGRVAVQVDAGQREACAGIDVHARRGAVADERAEPDDLFEGNQVGGGVDIRREGAVQLLPRAQADGEAPTATAPPPARPAAPGAPVPAARPPAAGVA